MRNQLVVRADTNWFTIYDGIVNVHKFGWCVIQSSLNVIVALVIYGTIISNEKKCVHLIIIINDMFSLFCWSSNGTEGTTIITSLKVYLNVHCTQTASSVFPFLIDSIYTWVFLSSLSYITNSSIFYLYFTSLFFYFSCSYSCYTTKENESAIQNAKSSNDNDDKVSCDDTASLHPTISCIDMLHHLRSRSFCVRWDLEQSCTYKGRCPFFLTYDLICICTSLSLRILFFLLQIPSLSCSRRSG